MNPAVMVVEDEPLIRFVLVDALEDKGLQIIEAASALEAVGLLSKYPEIGVVFTDVDMPGGLNGVDFAKLIANVHPHIGIRLRPDATTTSRRNSRRVRASCRSPISSQRCTSRFGL